MKQVIFVFTVVAALAGAAAAEPVVLAIDKGLVYVDLGADDGVGYGSELELIREVVVTDPVTRATLRDKFALGTLVVVKAGEKVCEARAESAIAGRVRVGDEIRLASSQRRFVDPWVVRVLESKELPDLPTVATGPTADRAAAARNVEETEAVRVAWAKTLGLPPRDRAAIWTAFVASRPTSPYAAAIRTEISSLEAQAVTLQRAADAAAAPVAAVDRRRALADALAELRGDRGVAPLWVGAPSRVSAGKPIAMAFTVRDDQPGAAWLFVRSGGSPNYRRIALARDGDAYLRATIPGELVKGGTIEWFVELGGGRPGVASRETPREITVDVDTTEPPPAPDRTTIRTSLDYVDFDGGLADGFDQYYLAEADFTYRFLRPVYAMRLGFGSLTGKGGPKDVIDADPLGECRDEGGAYHCRSVSFSYVYTEVELHPTRFIAVMLRPQAGLLTADRMAGAGSPNRCRDSQDLAECEFFTRLGFRLRARFGDERSTNLELGVGVTDGVGTLFEAAYNFTARPEVPVHFAVQVTDLPVTTDFGVRLVADVGYRGRAWVYPSLRLSYQARDIDHGGLSGGLGLNFDW